MLIYFKGAVKVLFFIKLFYLETYTDINKSSNKSHKSSVRYCTIRRVLKF